LFTDAFWTGASLRVKGGGGGELPRVTPSSGGDALMKVKKIAVNFTKGTGEMITWRWGEGGSGDDE